MKDLRNNLRCFEGAMIVLSGDFRQTLPVIPRSTATDEMHACLKSSTLWRYVKKLELTTNVRVALLNDLSVEDLSRQLLAIGDYYYYGSSSLPVHRKLLDIYQLGDSRHHLQRRNIPDDQNTNPTYSVVNGTDTFGNTTLINGQQVVTTELPTLLSKVNSEVSTTILNVSNTNHKLEENGVNLTLFQVTTPSMNTPLINNKNNTDNDDILLDDFIHADINKTLEEHHIKTTQRDDHLYYNSSFTIDPTSGKNYWIDLDNNINVKVNALLSRSHRRAATIQLSFDFPFYGHLIHTVTIATGGFMYTGEYVHSWLAATQYIAPLMANFDTSLSNDSNIKYVDNGTAFTVQWENVSLQDKPDDGEFTFQATLHSNGDIIFVYKKIPVIIENIEDDFHPVKIGLSDAYIVDRTIFLIRKKTIYEYHRVNFKKEDIKNWTVIYLTASPTCRTNINCTMCLTNKIPNFKCTWCPTVMRCSDGMDRYRQDWLTKGCDKRQYRNTSECTSTYEADINRDQHVEHEYSSDLNNFQQESRPGNINSEEMVHSETSSSRKGSSDIPVTMGVPNVVALLMLVGIVVSMGFWIMYAYRNPHTTSGQLLIRYRPSQWRWRRGEARYTAATIHM